MLPPSATGCRPNGRRRTGCGWHSPARATRWATTRSLGMRPDPPGRRWRMRCRSSNPSPSWCIRRSAPSPTGTCRTASTSSRHRSTMPGCVTSGRRSCTPTTGRWPRWTGCSTDGAPRTGRSGTSMRASPGSSPRQPGCRSSPPIWSTRAAASMSTARALCWSPTPCNSTPAAIRALPGRRWRRSWRAPSAPRTPSGCRRA